LPPPALKPYIGGHHLKEYGAPPPANQLAPSLNEPTLQGWLD